MIAAWAAALLLSAVSTRLLPAARTPWAIAASWAIVALGAVGWRHRGAWTRFGFAPTDPLRDLGWCTLYCTVVLPPFAALYLWWFGFSDWHWPGASLFGSTLIEHLVLAALPEELFFRGYVQTRLTDRFGARTRRVLGVRLGVPVVLAAGLFAITHLAYTDAPLSATGLARLLTLFPGLLFGALREETGDVLAPTLFHAACNATLLTLQAGYTSA